MHEKAKFVPFIYMQPQIVKLKSVQINMKQVSGIQFNLLLSPYPCFISLLYLDLYVLGDDALIR